MEEEKKEDKVIKLFSSLPCILFRAFLDVFIIVILVELGYLIYKTTGVGSFFLLNFLLLKILIVGFLYLMFIYLVVYLFIKYFLPNLKEQREKRKKEFFEEVSKIIKKELKSKK